MGEDCVPTQVSELQAQPTNLTHEKSHPSQAQKLVMESMAFTFFLCHREPM